MMFNRRVDNAELSDKTSKSVFSRGLSWGSKLMSSIFDNRSKIQNVLDDNIEENLESNSEILEVEEPISVEKTNSTELINNYEGRLNGLSDLDDTTFYQEEIEEDYAISLFHAKGHKPTRNPLEVVIPNEDKLDYFHTADGKRVVIVLDGMSQSNRSSIFVTNFLDKLKNYISQTTLSSIDDLISYINTVLLECGVAEHYRETPGATCAMVVESTDDNWFYFSVGDAIIGKKHVDGTYEKLNHEQITVGGSITSWLQPGVPVSKTKSEEELSTSFINSKNIGRVSLNEGESLFLASDGVNYLSDEPLIASNYADFIHYFQHKDKQDKEVFYKINKDPVNAYKTPYENQNMKDNVSHAIVSKSKRQDSILLSPELSLDHDLVSSLRLSQSTIGVSVKVVINFDGSLDLITSNLFDESLVLPFEFYSLLENLEQQVAQYPKNPFARTMLINKFNNQILNLPIIPVVKSELAFTRKKLSELHQSLIDQITFSEDNLKNHDSLANFVLDFSNNLLQDKPNSVAISYWLQKNLNQINEDQLAPLFQFSSVLSDSLVYPIPDILSDNFKIYSFEDLLISERIIDILLDTDASYELSAFVNKYYLQESITTAFKNIDLLTFSKLSSRQWNSLIVNCSRVINSWDSPITRTSIDQVLQDMIFDMFSAKKDVPLEFLQFLTKHFKHFFNKEQNLDFLLTHITKFDYDVLSLIVNNLELSSYNKTRIAKILVTLPLNHSVFYNLLESLDFYKFEKDFQLEILSIEYFDVNLLNNLENEFAGLDIDVRKKITDRYFEITLQDDERQNVTCTELELVVSYDENLKKIKLINKDGLDVTYKYHLGLTLEDLERRLKVLPFVINPLFLSNLLLRAQDKAQLRLDESKVSTKLFKARLFSGMRRTSGEENASKGNLISRVWSRIKTGKADKTNETTDSKPRLSWFQDRFNMKVASVLTPLVVCGGAALYYYLMKEPLPDPEFVQAAVKLKTQSVLSHTSSNIFPGFETMSDLFDNSISQLKESANLFLNNAFAEVSQLPIGLENMPMANGGADVVVDTLLETSFSGEHLDLTKLDNCLSDIYQNTQAGLEMAQSEFVNLSSFTAEVITENQRLLARDENGNVIRLAGKVLGANSGSYLEFNGEYKLFKVMIEGQEAIIKYFKSSTDGNYYAGTYLAKLPLGI